MSTSPASEPVELQARLDLEVEQRRRLEARLLRTEAQLQERAVAYEHLLAEVNQLRATLSQVEIQAQRRQEQLEVQLAQQGSASNQALQAQVTELSQRILAAQQTLSEQNNRLQTAEGRLQQVTAENLQLSAQVGELETQVAARQKLNERQRQDIEDLQEQLERQQLVMIQERRQGEARQQEWQANLLEAQDVAEKRVDMLQRFKAELSLARTQISETQGELNALRTLHADQLAAWEEQRGHLEARLAGYAETEAEAEQRWQEERLQVAQSFAALQAEMRALEERLAESQHGSDQLRGQLAEHQGLFQELQSAQGRIQELEEHNARLGQSLLEHSNEMQAHSAITAELEAQVGLLKEKIVEQQSHILRLKTALVRTAEPAAPEDAPAAKEPAVVRPTRASNRTAELPGFLRS